MAGDSSLPELPPASEIMLPPQERQKVRYWPQVMARTGMPYVRLPPDTPYWVRKNGPMTVTLYPGVGQDENGHTRSIGFPYGMMPRLLGMWVTTEAARTKSPDLVLGESLDDFMDQLGIEKRTGGERGTITQLKDQADRYFSSIVAVRIDRKDKHNGLGSTESWRAPVADHHALLWRKPKKGQTEMLLSTVTLSPAYFKMCTDRPVPVDAATIRKLRKDARGSAMRLDVYVWLTHRMSYTSEPTFVPWDSLLFQFGSSVDPNDRKGSWKFKQDFKANLQKVLDVYDKAAARPDDNGVWLLPGGTDVRPSQSRELLALEKQWRQEQAANRPALF